MNSPADSYLEFLRWCLHPTAEAPSCTASIRWHELLGFANAQAIAGPYWSGMQRLGSLTVNKPTDDDVLEWMAGNVKRARRNAKADAALISLAHLFQPAGIGYFVFKGQVISRCYPDPTLRSSGDIDFYVFRHSWQAAISLLSSRVKLTDAGSVRHVEFSHGGIPFEMHYATAVFASRRNQRRWDSLMEQSEASLTTVNVGGADIPTLGATLNAIYLFIHIYHHFLKEGVGLRQFIDWMYFLERHHAEVDPSSLSSTLASLGLTRAFRAFGTVLTDVLGMPASCFPMGLGETDRRWTARIMDIVVRYGNFGQYGRREHSGSLAAVGHSAETGLRSVSHMLRFMPLSARENLLYIPKLTWLSLRKNLRRALRFSHNGFEQRS